MTPPSRKLLGMRKPLSANALIRVPNTVYMVSFMARGRLLADFIKFVYFLILDFTSARCSSFFALRSFFAEGVKYLWPSRKRACSLFQSFSVAMMPYMQSSSKR